MLLLKINVLTLDLRIPLYLQEKYQYTKGLDEESFHVAGPEHFHLPICIEIVSDVPQLPEGPMSCMKNTSCQITL